MATHRNIERICWAALALALLAAALFWNGERLGLQPASRAQGYETRLFDDSRVHTIAIVMDDWEEFLEGCEDEEYRSCAVVVDGEAYKNIALRAKGNTSLSSVKNYGNNRYSFKIEFDRYSDGNTYYGLDKLCLNNIIQDNTYMKDYLAYTLMRENGVPSPLCSFAYLTVNGEDWGLYLAVEAIEDGFLTRNYGRDQGALYKPDSMSFGGGRGNGRDFKMDDLDFDQLPEGMENGGFPEGFPTPPEGFPGGMEGFSGRPEGNQMNGGAEAAPDSGGDASASGEAAAAEGESASGQKGGRRGGGGPGGFGGMGSSDVKLQYIDDDPDSYPNIFDNAKTEISDADKARLIASLKKLSAQEDLESVVDIDEVLRYFTVHDFLCNDDSYTGSIVHNYYLYEKDGVLSMLPWDYNLSFGTMGGGSDASEAVNSPIDSPVSGELEDRPMAAWIFSSEEYIERYHAVYAQLVASLTENDHLAETIRATRERIAPYVEKDPTKFCTVEEFETGVETLLQFCALRLESIAGQLEGTIPSTSEGQAQDGSALVDASAIRLSDMGTMNNGGGPGGFGGDRGGFGGRPGERNGESQNAPAADGAELTNGAPENADTAGASEDREAILDSGAEENSAPGGAERPQNGASESGDASKNSASEGAERPQNGVPDNEGASKDNAPTDGAAPQNGGPGGMQPPGMRGAAQDTPSGAETALLLGVSIAVLLAGLGFAVKFKR